MGEAARLSKLHSGLGRLCVTALQSFEDLVLHPTKHSSMRETLQKICLSKSTALLLNICYDCIAPIRIGFSQQFLFSFLFCSLSRVPQRSSSATLYSVTWMPSYFAPETGKRKSWMGQNSQLEVNLGKGQRGVPRSFLHISFTLTFGPCTSFGTERF